MSPSGLEETLGVLRTGLAIAITSYLVIAGRAAASTSGAAGLLPYQVLFRDLPAPVQRTYRQMTEGLLEIEMRLPATGRFPLPEELAAEGIPPFAPDPIARPPLSWRLVDEPEGATYLGSPAGPGPSFLLQIQRGAPSDPSHAGAVQDEGHRTLPGGVVLHVSSWVRQDSRTDPGSVLDPAREGYLQILSRDPLREVLR